MTKPDTLDVFLMRHARYEINDEVVAGIALDEVPKITRSIQDHVIGRYIGFSYTDRVIKMRNQLSGEARQAMPSRASRRVDLTSFNTFDDDFMLAEQQVAREFRAGMEQLVVNGLHLAVLSSKDEKATPTAQVVSDVLSRHGLLRMIGDQPYATSRSIEPSASFYELRLDSSPEELVSEALQGSEPALPVLTSIDGLIIVGHEPFLKALAHVEYRPHISTDYNSVIHTEFPVN